MRPPRKKPGKGSQKTPTWSNEKLKGGGMYNGWKAGDVEWVLVHHIGTSKPCYAEMTDGKLGCPYCKPKCRRDWIGYVPIYDSGGKRLLAIVQDYSETVVEKIGVYDPVRVRRGPEHHDPITVEPSKWTADPYAKLKKGERGVDIWDALLVLWNQPLLKAYFADSSDIPVSPPAPPSPPATDDEPIPQELLDRSPRRLGNPSQQRVAATVVGDLVDEITWPGKPSKNGKHDPPSG